MINLEQTIEKSIFGKIKNGLSGIKHSVAGKIAVYSLAGVLSVGAGCGWDPFQNDVKDCYQKLSDSACYGSCWNSFYECSGRADYSACIDTDNCEKLCCESDESLGCWYTSDPYGTGKMVCLGGSGACETEFSECKISCENTASNCQGRKVMDACYDQRAGCETLCCISLDGCYAASDVYGNVECIDEPSNDQRSNMKCEDYVDTQAFADCISTDACGAQGMSECIKSCCEKVSCYGYCSLNEVDRCKGQINCWDLITH